MLTLARYVIHLLLEISITYPSLRYFLKQCWDPKIAPNRLIDADVSNFWQLMHNLANLVLPWVKESFCFTGCLQRARVLRKRLEMERERCFFTETRVQPDAKISPSAEKSWDGRIRIKFLCRPWQHTSASICSMLKIILSCDSKMLSGCINHYWGRGET